MNYKKLISIIADKTAAQWDALETEAALTEVFEKNYDDVSSLRSIFESEYNADAALTDFYADEDFATVAASLDEAAASVITVLDDVLAHLPEPAASIQPDVDYIISRMDPDTPEGGYLYAAVLKAMLNGDFSDRLKAGFSIPEARAARRAYGRYLAFKTGSTGNTGVVISDPDEPETQDPDDSNADN